MAPFSTLRKRQSEGHLSGKATLRPRGPHSIVGEAIGDNALVAKQWGLTQLKPDPVRSGFATRLACTHVNIVLLRFGVALDGNRRHRLIRGLDR